MQFTDTKEFEYTHLPTFNLLDQNLIKKDVMFISQPVKMNLNKKLDPKQKTIQTFHIDAQGFRKTKNENPPTWEMEVTC